MRVVQQGQYLAALKSIWRQHPEVQRNLSQENFIDLFPLIWVAENKPDEPLFPEDMAFDRAVFDEIVDQYEQIFPAKRPN